jgi:putative transposase
VPGGTILQSHPSCDVRAWGAILQSQRPGGASGCSHGWSGGAARPADAEPVEAGSLLLFFSPQRGEGFLMPGTYSQLLLHVVFSTKGRTPWISAEVAARLCPYIGGIVRAEKGVLYEIGGVEDHVHLYLRWRPDGSVSDLMRTVKARSSKWVHATFPNLAGFAWQEGFSVFSVSKSQEKAVKEYIAGQAEHHKREDFRSELLRFLKAHGIEYNEKYVFD